jgi:phosphatidylserine/phosphatidylglycerophosphate/cardiolipin synthase-like enzyme
VSAEADLWFGPLVETRSRDGIMLHPDVAEALRAGLDGGRAVHCRQITRRLHEYLPPALQLEEELNFLALDAERNAKKIDKLLRSALRALVGNDRGEVANWAGRALPRLPPAVRATDSAAMLAVASDLRLGRGFAPAAHLTGNTIPDWFADVVPQGFAFAKVELGVSATTLGLMLDPTPGPHAQWINVPATEPRVVQISAYGETQLVFVEPDTPLHVPITFDERPIALVTLAGEAFTIERIDDSATAAAPDHRLACRAYANCNQALIAWQIGAPIERCLGFALERIGTDGQSEFINNVVGFPGMRAQAREQPRPSSVWPIQRFTWIDRAPQRGTPFSYRITPVIGAPGVVEVTTGLAAETNPVEVAIGSGPITAVFNNERAGAREQFQADLVKGSSEKQRAAREFFGGQVRGALLSLLNEARAQAGEVYLALFELDDVELLNTLDAVGERANIILSRGPEAMRNSKRLDEVRKRLAGTRLYLRRKAQRYSHTRFMVVCDREGKPQKVWTGSLPWTSSALYGKDSNALIIEDAAVAARYFAQWQRLRDDPTPASLMIANAQSDAFTLTDGARIRLRFAPVRDRADVEDVRACLSAARSAVLFVMGPQPQKSILADIVRLSRRLYVAGVAHPASSLTKVAVYQYGGAQVVKPQRVPTESFGIEGLPAHAVRVALGSRLIVIDPFGDRPIVIAGSHTLSDGASRSNDEDLLIIEGNRTLAQACAVHIKGLIDHYSFRARARSAKAVDAVALRPNDGWQSRFMTGEREHEIRFWVGAIGERSAAAVYDDVAPPKTAPAKKAAAKKTPAKKPVIKTAKKKATKKATPKTSAPGAKPTKKVARKSTSRKTTRRTIVKKKK